MKQFHDTGVMLLVSDLHCAHCGISCVVQHDDIQYFVLLQVQQQQDPLLLLPLLILQLCLGQHFVQLLVYCQQRVLKVGQHLLHMLHLYCLLSL